VRLLCVYQHAPTPGAPGIYRHRLLLGELSRRGWDVDLVSTPVNYMTGVVPEPYRRRLYRRERIEDVEHHWVWASRGIHASRARRALNYVSFATTAALRAATLPRPDVLLASSPPLSVATLGAALARRFRRPWVLEVRDVWPESAVSVGWLDEGSRTYRALERLAHRHARGAARVIVPTPGLVERLRAHGATEVDVVPGSVFDSPPDPALRARVRSVLGVGADTCLFAYVGAVGAANGIDLLLDAVGLLPQALPAAFVVAGDGSDRERLEARAQDEGLGSVRFVGAVPKAEVAAVLAAADVCLHLLRRDPVFATALPSKVLEYFGAHRPVVTTVPGLPEQLVRESGGGYAPSAEELAEEIERWTRMSPAEREAKGDQALAYGLERFGLQASADKLEASLLRAAEARVRP
jgi:colanic acid biosynthesis glycosyl transferase WcaI